VAPMKWFTLEDAYSQYSSLAQMRERLALHYGITDVELERRILMDADVNMLYRGMIRFMEAELAMKEMPSRNQLNKAAKLLARQMMLRNEAYSGLVNENFKDHIRLSMHPSINNGKKFSFQLIQSEKAIYSPWHGALLVDEMGDLATIHKKDAIEKGYELVMENGRPYYYAAN
jgi:pyoverdine/dityrosine biosynthesis protein Dit1